MNRFAPKFLIVIILTISGQFVTGQAKYIGRNFIDYCSAVPWEDIFVHVDRDKYIAGENIWFKVYAFDRKSMKPTVLSKIAYVELLNYDNRPVIRKRIYLEYGGGPGQIKLPDTLSTGIYTIRAYTVWMKNFLPEGSFIKEITVYNALNNNQLIRRPPRTEASASPEAPQKTPGFQLSTDNSQPGLLEILFNTDAGFRSTNGEVCNLLIHTRGNINISESIPLTGDQTLKVISTRQLMPGINHITVFDVMGRILAEKYIYTPGSSETLKPASGATAGKRDKIMVITGSDKPGSDFSKLSISITPYTGERSAGLREFLLFGNEFGNLLAAKLYGRDLSSIPQKSIDSILSALSSKWINWNIIAGKDSLSVKYQPESKMHFLSGTLLNSSDPDNYVIMSIPGKQAVFQYAVIDRKGEFSFGVPIDEEVREMIIQPDDMTGAVNLNSSFAENYVAPGHVFDTIPVPAYIKDWSANFQVQKIYGIPVSENMPPNRLPNRAKRFYGKPDIELVLADYIKLPLMEEVFFELLPGTFLRKRRSAYEIYVTDPVTNLQYEFPTELFVDGVRVKDANAIAALDPEVVEQIDVIRERYMVGDYLFHGIVNVITKTGDFSSVNLPDYAVRTFYRVIDPVERFVSPEYEKPESGRSRIPDFRNTLWWNPSLKPGDPAECWSSDIPGEYIIRINGIAADGSPLSSEQIITIK